MSDCLSAEAQRSIARLANSDLNGLTLADMGRSLELSFSFMGFAGGEGHDVLLRLGGVERLRFDCPRDSESVYFVGEATLDCVEGNGADNLFRLRLEGEVSIEVVCAVVQVFEEVGVSNPAATAIIRTGKDMVMGG